MKKEKLIIWDFDGVLCDSLKECIVVTKIASYLIQNNDLNLEIHKIINPLEVENLYSKMKPLRAFIINGQDYIWQHQNLDSFNKKFNSYEEYKIFFDKIYNPAMDKLFEEFFYKSRKILQSYLEKEYFKLFNPFKEAIYALRTSLKINNNYICSARDYLAIKLILKNQGVEFPENKVYCKDKNFHNNCNLTTKSNQIIDIIEKEGYEEKEFFLIEDQVKCPLELISKYPKMKTIFASYGYGIKEDWAKIYSNDIVKADDPGQLIEIVIN